MKKCRITVMRIACYKDLMEAYENPIPNACNMVEGQVFVANGWQKPEGFCDSAWESISPFVMTLSYGGEDIYSGWMKNKKSALISCNDGFRPVSFLIEALDEESD
ncbi:MAG: TIGR04076 family protein [Clostridiales bacterium]|nr:TIGR04076 family protein [Clostridiales bacterium]